MSKWLFGLDPFWADSDPVLSTRSIPPKLSPTLEASIALGRAFSIPVPYPPFAIVSISGRIIKPSSRKPASTLTKSKPSTAKRENGASTPSTSASESMNRKSWMNTRSSLTPTSVLILAPSSSKLRAKGVPETAGRCIPLGI